MTSPAESSIKPTLVLRALSTLAVSAVAVFLIAALVDIPDDAAGLTALAAQHLPSSGVDHPVTAVLLNYRAYDTWLEVGVLLIAVMGMLLFHRRSDLQDIRSMPLAEPVLEWAIKLLFPMIVLVSGYLLWTGKYSSGGAFQAGVVLGAGGVLLWIAGHRSITAFRGPLFRGLLILGFVSFFIVTLANVALQRPILDLPEQYAGTIILLIEAAATLTIAITVAALIIGVQPLMHDSSPSAEVKDE